MCSNEIFMNEGTFFIWHRCDKELPNENEAVLTTDEFGNVIINMRINGEWRHKYADMIAWGRIPEPYRGCKIIDG